MFRLKIYFDFNPLSWKIKWINSDHSWINTVENKNIFLFSSLGDFSSIIHFPFAIKVSLCCGLYVVLHSYNSSFYRRATTYNGFINKVQENAKLLRFFCTLFLGLLSKCEMLLFKAPLKSIDQNSFNLHYFFNICYQIYRHKVCQKIIDWILGNMFLESSGQIF